MVGGSCRGNRRSCWCLLEGIGAGGAPSQEVFVAVGMWSEHGGVGMGSSEVFPSPMNEVFTGPAAVLIASSIKRGVGLTGRKDK